MFEFELSYKVPSSNAFIVLISYVNPIFVGEDDDVEIDDFAPDIEFPEPIEDETVQLDSSATLLVDAESGGIHNASSSNVYIPNPNNQVADQPEELEAQSAQESAD